MLRSVLSQTGADVSAMWLTIHPDPSLRAARVLTPTRYEDRSGSERGLR